MQFYDLDPSNSGVKLDEILPHLYLSNRYGAWNLELLHEKHITHVLVVGEELSTYFPGHFIYQQLFFRDDGSEAESLKFGSSIPTALTFITTALRDPGNNILVHCSQGISRSSAIVAAYLISLEEYSMNVDDALTWIQHARAMVQPNEKFVAQLRQFHMHSRPNVNAD
jgi:dual specificity phosphatase 12